MKDQLSDRELETYARQIVLEEIGYEGQIKIRNARAAIIGMGGLGSLIAPKLVGMGIGHLRMVDRDIVSRSDLHRQHLYGIDSLGRPKVEVALKRMGSLNPDVTLEAIPESLNSTNADDLLKDVDVVLDGLDRPEARYVVNRTCQRHKIPYVFGGAIQTVGNVTTLVPGRTLCLECFMGGLKDENLPKCGVVGVHPAILGLVTAVQVFEAVNILVGCEPKLLDKLLFMEMEDLKFHKLELGTREDCPVCGIKPSSEPEPLVEDFFEETCARDGRRNFVISPKKRIELDLGQLPDLLKEKGFSVKSSGIFGITFDQSKEMTTSILKSGIMIVQTSPKVTSNIREALLGTYRSILVDGLGFSSKIVPEA